MVDAASIETAPGYGMPPEIQAAYTELKTLETSIVLARAQFARQVGITFEGERDTFSIFGYDRIITTRQYRERYLRGGIAGAAVDVFPDATWRGSMELVEDEDPKQDTEFEKAWKAFDTKHQVQAKFRRVDKLAGLSTYAVLLIGAAGSLDTELPKSNGKGPGILFLRPCSGSGGPNNGRSTATLDDSDCTVYEYETDVHSERFGLPKTYRLRITGVASPDLNTSVHWTRIHHIAEGCLEDDIFGMPRLERIWNLLDNLDKVTGGGSEAFFLRANQGLHLDVDKDMELKTSTGASDVATVLTSLREQSEAYKHQLDRWIRTKGVKVKTLGSDVADFSGPADAIETQIAGSLRIPKRILTGAEMGELASSQDRDNWKDQVNGRQESYAGPYIVRPLVDRLIEYGYLPTPKGGADAYKVVWPHIQTLTEQEKVEGAKGWASVNQTNGEVVFTDAEIRDKWAGYEPLTDDQRQEMVDRAAEKLAQQQDAMGATAQPGPDGVTPNKVLPFARAAEDRELIRVLTAAIECGNLDVVAQIVGLEYKYGSTQVQLPAEIAAKLIAFGKTIDDADIYEPEGGRETDAHVTVKYGLLKPDAKELGEVVGRRGPVSMTFGKTSMFATSNYDVVFVEVNSPDLADLNAAITTEIDCKPSNHGAYRPHATVAYVKPGAGVKYTGFDVLGAAEVTVDQITLCDADGNKTVVSLA